MTQLAEQDQFIQLIQKDVPFVKSRIRDLSRLALEKFDKLCLV